ncbi:hypothetical protein MSG28_005517 [Choristoneura fumiferana]|uniref:Uncharacterized protein n=1 Tax=Choristoneura fumiferana TaxID=7141 RepID=A0ACC0L067_CHOFU|nr:hypothetical protein MSG28_005517 [Choristoneura fumiferana]
MHCLNLTPPCRTPSQPDYLDITEVFDECGHRSFNEAGIVTQVPTEPLTGNLRLVCASEDALADLFDLDPQVEKQRNLSTLWLENTCLKVG